MFISLIKMPLSSFFTHWNPTTSSKIQIKCPLTWESSNYLLTPIVLMISVFIGPSRLPSYPFSYPEWHISFIPQSSQFKYHYFFQPFNPSTVTAHSTNSLKNQLFVGCELYQIIPSASKYIHVPASLSLPQSGVSLQILHLCFQLLSFPHLEKKIWGFCHISHTFDILFSTVSLSSYSLLVLLLFILNNVFNISACLSNNCHMAHCLFFIWWAKVWKC